MRGDRRGWGRYAWLLVEILRELDYAARYSGVASFPVLESVSEIRCGSLLNRGEGHRGIRLVESRGGGQSTLKKSRQSALNPKPPVPTCAGASGTPPSRALVLFSRAFTPFSFSAWLALAFSLFPVAPASIEARPSLFPRTFYSPRPVLGVC